MDNYEAAAAPGQSGDAGTRAHAPTEDVRLDGDPAPDDTFAPTLAEWQARAGEMAEWTWETLVNRRDVFGDYIEGKDGIRQNTNKRPLTREVLRKHFAGRKVVGLHTTVHADGSSWSRWLVVDIDRHDGKGDPAANLGFALAIYAYAVSLGFRALLIDSNGRGGYHIFLIFDGPVETWKVFAFGRWLVRDWRKFGVAEGPEVFPKQAAITADGKGSFGNWVRIFGRHHKNRHFSRVWDGSRWLDGNEAIDHILATKGTPPSAVPTEAVNYRTSQGGGGRKGKVVSRPSNPTACGRPDEAARAEDALRHLGAEFFDDYDRWLAVGFALHSLGPIGLEIWDRWSRSSAERYQPGACAGKWATMADGSPGGSRITIASLYYWAIQNGWKDDSPTNPPTAAMKAGTNGDGHDAGSDREERQAEADERAKSDAATFANYTEESFDSKDGVKFVKFPCRVAELDAMLDRIAPGWPRRCVESLFVPSAGHEPVYLSSATRFFSWLDGMALVDWTKGDQFVTQERYYEHLRMSSEQYEAVETLPQWPPLPGHYYMHEPVVWTSGGKLLDRLLDRFNPLTDCDKELIRAFILTLFWGGPPGSRPAWLVTGADDDPKSGRGIGKSHLIAILAEELARGFIDVSPTDQIADVKTRLLSPEARHIRVARLDNVKTLRFSWADLEGLITSPIVSGRELYIGEGRRPNTLVWAITLNGASLSKDMSQRVIVIKLARPDYDPLWESSVREFVRANRPGLLAEIRAALEDEPGMVEPTRWAVWERNVLAKTDDLKNCQKLIAERQRAIDDDQDEKDLVTDYFVEQLEFCDHRPADKVCVRIPSRWAAEWLSEATRKSFATNAASAHLRGMGIDELTYERKTSERGWIWRGANAGGVGPVKLNDWPLKAKRMREREA